jgi:TolB-like protein
MHDRPSPTQDPLLEGPSDCTEVITESDTQNPKLINRRYLLVKEIGGGGFGVTWLARDTQVAGRNVVVKIPLEHRSDAWSIQKFRGEMEALARIDDPGVVGVHDFGQLEDGRSFLVMQYVPGSPLRESLLRERMPLARVAMLMQQIGRALTAAHDAGVCHCDLKPENIIIHPDARGGEQAKLIDFGLATIQKSADSTNSSKVSGTWSYMAPEQFHGQCTPASDVYQMGVVAYEMATGIKPFRALSPGGQLREKTEGLKELPRRLRPDLPEAAEAAIVRALSPDPEERHRRASDFGDSLAAALGDRENERLGGLPEPSGFQVNALFSRPLLVAALIVVLLVTAGVGYLWWKNPTVDAESVAVLPFENRFNDPDTAYLSEGVTESLINDLSHIPTLHIRARGAVLKYSGDHVDPMQAGRDLHVTRIVVGSVSSRRDELRIEAELIDVRTGTRLWGSVYTRPMSNFADAMAEFSTEVTDQLRLKLSGPLKERLARQYVTGSGAYKLYLEARYHLNKRTPADFDQAVSLFEEAIAKNPSYAPAYAGLASAYEVMASFLGDPAPLLEKSRDAAQQAIDLDGTLAESYASLACVDMQANYQWGSAEKNFLRAIELNPNWPEAREGYALELAANQRFDEALRQIKIAQELDPSSPGLFDAHVLILYLGGRYDESLTMLRALSSQRGNGSPGELIAEDVAEMTAENYWAKGMAVEALNALRVLKNTSDDVEAPLLVIGYARVGQTDKAEDLARHFAATNNATAWYTRASAEVNLGHKAQAINDLEHSHYKRAFEVMFAAVDPMLNPLRGEPAFRSLLAEMNLKPVE